MWSRREAASPLLPTWPHQGRYRPDCGDGSRQVKLLFLRFSCLSLKDSIVSLEDQYRSTCRCLRSNEVFPRLGRRIVGIPSILLCFGLLQWAMRLINEASNAIAGVMGARHVTLVRWMRRLERIALTDWLSFLGGAETAQVTNVFFVSISSFPQHVKASPGRDRCLLPLMSRPMATPMDPSRRTYNSPCLTVQFRTPIVRNRISGSSSSFYYDSLSVSGPYFR